MRVNVSHFQADAVIKDVSFSDMNTRCKLTLSADTVPVISGDTPDTLKKTFANTLKTNSYGSAFFYVAVPKITSESICAITVRSDDMDTAIWCSEYHSAPSEADALVNVTSRMTKVRKYGDTGYFGIYLPATGQVWAPVNCGFDENHRYGLLYQWGRMDGCGYTDEWTDPSGKKSKEDGPLQTNIQAGDGLSPTLHPEKDKFYSSLSWPCHCDWYGMYTLPTTIPTPFLPSWPMRLGDSGYAKDTIGNPCPAGWRVPTYDEMKALWGRSSTSISYVDAKKLVDTLETLDQPGIYFDGTANPNHSGVFLPIAGCRDYYSSQYAKYYPRSTYTTIDGPKSGCLFYWSATDYPDYDHCAYAICWFNDYSYMYFNGNIKYRAYGASVRCIQELE